MKYTCLFSAILLSLSFFEVGCQDPDSLVQTDSVNALTVKGRLVSDETMEYGSVIDNVNHVITVLVPYYISDTEAIQGDLTQMRLSATMPAGAKFKPSIAGIRDLKAGFQATYIDRNGVSTPYTFKARYAKDTLAQITSFKLSNYQRATIRIVDPTKAGEIGSVIIYKTSSAIDGALRSAQISLKTSPWATTDLSSGIVDLSMSDKIITVTSQDGNTVSKYKVVIQIPDLTPSGELGYVSSLFGFQTLKTDTHGFMPSANRSLAVIGDYLIVSNSTDVSKMLVLDRYNGSNVNKSVNTTGISRKIFAITSDDAQHLVAITYTNNSSLPVCQVWVWANGIESTPTLLISKNILTDDYFSSLRENASDSYDLGRMISVKGNVLSGNAVIGTTCVFNFKNVFFFLNNGKLSTTSALAEFKGDWVDMWYETKPVIVKADKDLVYVWGTGTGYRRIQYINADKSVLMFDVPDSWWDEDIKGLAYTEFNGTKLLGIQNGGFNDAWDDGFNRLIVANISNMSTNSLVTGQVFDSRLSTTIPGAGYSVTGITSYYPFTSGEVLGSNGNHTGDVCFGKSEDGNAVQVYMLTTDHGIIAYEITRFRL